MQENGGNFVFVDYKMTNRVLNLLRKHHCNQTDSNLHLNPASSSEIHVILKQKNCALDYLLDSRSGLLSYLIDLPHRSCQGRTRDIEDVLFKYPDKAIQISGYSCDDWKAQLPE